jgi:hypothetical protein
MTEYLDISELKGKTLTEAKNNDNEEIVFVTDRGETYKLYHDQDCCESVTVKDIVGDLNDLIGSPLLMAEEVSSEGEPPPADGYEPESYTWTFYKLATAKGYVTIRWYGTSNGYYSESVSFVKV